MSSTKLLIASLLLISACSFLSGTGAFVPGAQIRPYLSLPSSLWAKKKKRRRKSPSPASDSSDLPDFDLKEEMAEEVEETPPKPSMSAASSDEEITANMIGSADKPIRSVKELIADRALESKFEFDAPEDESLPDLAQVAQSKQSDEPTPGSKRERQAARKAAAKAKEQEENEESFLSKIPVPFIRDENGKVTPLKVLEAGTWLGIFLLVGWEIYINSPLFERVAPMAPVVY